MVRVNHRSGKCWLVASRAFGCTDLSQPEVQNLGMTALGHEDVRWLDVTMNDTRRVGSIQRVSDLNSQRQYLVGLHWLATDAVLERYAIEKLHCDKAPSILLANFVDGTNIWMVQGGSSPCLPTKALQRLCVSGQFIGEELQGDESTKLSILGLVDHTHSTTANFLDNAVV